MENFCSAESPCQELANLAGGGGGEEKLFLTK